MKTPGEFWFYGFYSGRNRSIKTISFVSAALVYIWNIYRLVNHTLKLGLSPANFFRIPYILQYLNCIITHLTLYSKRDLLRDFIANNPNYQPRYSRYAARRIPYTRDCIISILLFVVVEICYVSEMSFKSYLIAMIGPLGLAANSKWYQYLMLPLTMTCYLLCSPSWVTASVTVFRYLLNQLHVSHHQYFGNITKLRNKKDFRRARMEFAKTRLLTFTFHKHLSHFLFLYTLHHFIICCSIIFDFQGTTSNERVPFLQVLEKMVECSAYTFLLVSIMIDNHHGNVRSSELITILKRKLITHSECTESVYLLEDIERFQGIKLTGWGMFVFDLKMLVGVLGGIVSFSAMFAQLVQ